LATYWALGCSCSRARQQRSDAAYWATLVLLGGGAVAALAKGLDWEEGLALAVLAAALAPNRRWFYRRSSLLSQSFSPSWMAGIAAVQLVTGFVVVLATSTTRTSCGGSSSSTRTRPARSARWPAASSRSVSSRWRGCCGRRAANP
jgi:lysylphosphatidylglycerol synthetase-like protein (DUF2156 family)